MAKPNKTPVHNHSVSINNTPTVPPQGAMDDNGRAVQSIGGAGFYAQQKPGLMDTPGPSNAYSWQSPLSNQNAYLPPKPPYY